MRQYFTLCLIFISQLFAFASTNSNEVGGKELSRDELMKQEIKSVIDHHLIDAHEFIFLSDKDGNNYGFSLPVILYDNGLVIFSSADFDHGNKVVEKDGSYYKLKHGKVYKTDAEGTIYYGSSTEPTKEHPFPTNEKPLDFSITKNVVMIIVTGLLMLLIFGSLARSYKKNNGIPKGVGRFFEPLVIYIRDEIAIPNIGEKRYKQYMPFLLTVFFFIWFLNMFGLTPLGVNVTGNIAVTSALAIFTFFITNLTGKRTYWAHIFDPLGSTMPWVAKIPLYFILIPIEVLGIFIKPFSLLIRLYANIAAGHIVLLSLIGLIFVFESWIGGPLSFGLTFAIILIKVLVAILQAYIFTMLSSLYFGFAAAEHEEAH